MHKMILFPFLQCEIVLQDKDAGNTRKGTKVDRLKSFENLIETWPPIRTNIPTIPDHLSNLDWNILWNLCSHSLACALQKRIKIETRSKHVLTSEDFKQYQTKRVTIDTVIYSLPSETSGAR